ncbi:MAG: cation-translocating P-type ATPase [Saprospiraceae bacterium]
MNHWHTLSVSDTLSALQSAETGLTQAKAQKQLQQFGTNELKEQARRHPWRMLWEQFTQTMVLILIAAALVSFLLGKQTETIAIAAIVVLFALLGFLQEYRAERAMAALRKLAVPQVRVRRDGKLQEISAQFLVPGDVIQLEAGNAVPADVRLLESINLRIQEATLTGESEPVEKHTDALQEKELALGDRKNMAYLGTVVTYGRGSAVVVETGMRTELGKIARLIQSVHAEQTPLQRKLDQVGKILAVAGIVAALAVLLLGLYLGETLNEVLLSAISVAVAVVPEGLPAVVTITLALGAQRMFRRKALIRKLPAVETLGSVTVICSDKTGTLTENRMTVTVVDVADVHLTMDELLTNDTPDGPDPISLALIASVLCNDAVLVTMDNHTAIGDPTETALLIAAAQKGFFKSKLEDCLPRIKERAFDSSRKRMTTLHLLKNNDLPPALRDLASLPYTAFTKGSVDGLIQVSDTVWNNNHLEPMTEEWRTRILVANDQLAQAGMRVLGIAFRQYETMPQDEELESKLVFLGLLGMIDPPRAAVAAAVQKCHQAGIRPVMITGDHPLTATAIAHQLRLANRSEVLVGEQLNRLSDEELLQKVETVSVYARVSPEDKLRIVQALQQKGHIVAMTGDGVNDSPALKKADIGVAMGITGTDVAKEASDMVLLDDNFATIVAAVEEGRSIYDNLLRFIKFSLGGNLGKVLVMLLAPFFGMVIALSPLQLLWLNLLTDGLMGLGLGVEPAEVGTMHRPPRSPQAPVFDRAAKLNVLWVGILIAILALGVGVVYYNPQHPEDTTWQTMIFATIGFTQIGNALGLRAYGYWVLSPKTNPLFPIVTTLALALQLAVIYSPSLDQFFGLTPLNWQDLSIAVALGVLMFGLVRLDVFVHHRLRLTMAVAKER